MRIALLSPPYVTNYMRNARCDFVSLSATQWYPLWLGYAGAWLEKCGHEVTLIDAPSAHLDYEATERVVTDWRPDMLVVYPGQRSRISDIEIADRLTEETNCIGVLVGPYFTPRATESLQSSRAVSYGIQREFDHPLAELADGVAPSNIKNLLYRDGDRIVVGAWLDDDGAILAGSAYIFRRDDNGTPSNPADDSWVEEAKLTASDAAAGDELGKSVSIDGDRAVVGAFEDDDACAQDPVPDPNCDSGSAYVFERDDNGTPLDASDDVWTQTVKLVASDTAPADFFGRVAIQGSTVVAGSLSDEAGDQAGAVYVFDVSQGCAPIPTVSQWGMVVMAMLLTGFATV
ncbi:MAG: cobalamin-dependent protein, partial [Planctomycetes bacterium]|nr:cobalamin-dependent protein [Planctomycetota bacterium]